MEDEQRLLQVRPAVARAQPTRGPRSGDVLVRLLGQQLRRRLGVVEELIYLLDVVPCDGITAAGLGQDGGGSEQLHHIPQGGVRADLAKQDERFLLDGQILGLSTDVHDLDDLVHRVRHRPDDDQTIEQVHGDAVRGDDVRPADGADAPVGGENNDRAQGGLEGAIQVSEALNVKHVHLVDEEHAWHQLCDSLVDIPVHDLVDLQPELLGDLGFPRLHEGAHDAREVLPALRLRVGLVEVVQCDVLNNFLLLVNVALGHWHVLVGFQVELRGVGVAAAYAPGHATASLDVDDIAHSHLLFLQTFINLRGQLQCLLTLCGLQANHHSGDLLGVATSRIWALLRGQLCDLSLVDLLGLLNADADGAPTILHEDLGLLYLG
mmetsp:Transcript_72019/g.154140  ORF Transcript_72019/g.154140 Transcript_72019/m.154140 type:complete len:378 (+) Transcript_72019:146-1279(+)